MMNLETTADSQTRVIPVDVEHGAIRVLLPILAIVAFAAGYLLTMWLINILKVDTAAGCIAFLVGVALASVVVIGANRFLGRLLPSGRSLLLSPEALVFRDRGTDKVRVDWNQRINVLTWRFTVPRTTVRAQKGWFMLGIQLLQDETVLSMYTFMSPKDAAVLPQYHTFTPLQARSAIQKNEVSLRELAEQRRLLQAEDERWQHGAEVQQEDFAALMAVVAQHMASQADSFPVGGESSG